MVSRGGWGVGRGWGRLGNTGGGMNCGNLGEGSGGRDFPWDTNTYIENSLRLFRLLGYLSTNIICSEKQTVFWKRNWGIFGQVIWLDQSRASENIWWIINKKYPQSGTKIYYDILSVDITFFFWNHSLRKTVSFMEQIMSKDKWSEHISAPNGYCVFPSNLFFFCNRHRFEN